MIARILMVCVATFVVTATLSAGDPPFPVSVAKGDTGERDHYCGLYCIYQAGQLTGHPVDLDRLLRPDYLTGKYGSSAANLLDCSRDFGIPTTYLPDTTYADACLLDGPLIALIRNSPESKVANHWILILRADADGADVYDPSVGRLRLGAAEMRNLWGGPVVAVHRENESAETRAAWLGGRVLLLALVLGVAFVVLRMMDFSRLNPMLALVIAAIGLAALGQSLDPAGFFHNRRTLDQISCSHHPREPVIVGPEAVLAPDRPVRILDVRTPPQFQSSRIPGAINIPISSSHWKNEQALAGMPREARLILYCNSESCGWSSALAQSSLLQEFPDVAVLKCGIDGYVAAGGTLERGRP